MEMNKVIVGQSTHERLLIGLLGQGHIILGGPGLAKTLQ
jgi:hypothetical protein